MSIRNVNLGDMSIEIVEEKCTHCNGGGKMNRIGKSKNCLRCGGTGVIRVSTKYQKVNSHE